MCDRYINLAHLLNSLVHLLLDPIVAHEEAIHVFEAGLAGDDFFDAVLNQLGV